MYNFLIGAAHLDEIREERLIPEETYLSTVTNGIRISTMKIAKWVGHI